MTVPRSRHYFRRAGAIGAVAITSWFGATCPASPPTGDTPPRHDDPTRALKAPPKSTDDAPAKVSEFPDNWYIHDPSTKTRYPGWEHVEGKPAKFLRVSRWFGEEQDLEKLKGKVVVIYFWSAECGPCLMDLPETGKLASDLKELGAVFFTIHDDTSGAERIPALIRQYKIDYPIGVDRFDVTAHEWEVRVHPVYAVIDGTGVVRALGLKPKRVREMVNKLLAELDAASGEGEVGGNASPTSAQPAVQKNDAAQNENDPSFHADIPVEWLEGAPRDRLRFKDLNTKNPPAITLDDWMNSEPLNLSELRGKVVLLDFWATWCGPCRAAAPKMAALYDEYKDAGLVVIGVCEQKQVENMRAVAKQLGMNYPLVGDTKGEVTKAYLVNSWPDYYFIDRSGALRIADCRNDHIEDAIKALLKEPAPADAHREGAEAEDEK